MENTTPNPLEQYPLPWRVLVTDEDVPYLVPAGVEQLSGQYHKCIPLYGGQALAKSIARAMNSHEALVSALKEMSDSLGAAFRVIATRDDMVDAFEGEFRMLGIADGVGTRADAALALAEGLS